MEHAKKREYGWAELAAERRRRERNETAAAFLVIAGLMALGVYALLS